MSQPAISVIVPVRNGGRFLSMLLPALEQQTLPRDLFDVIIADDCSTEAPEGVATIDGWIRVLSADEPTNSYAARNRGVAASRAEALAFCDADCIPDPSWLAAGLTALGASDIVAGSIRFLPPAQRTTWAFIDIEMTKNQRRVVDYGAGDTANLFMTRRTFERAGGFDEKLPSGGDYDFVQRCIGLGSRLAYCADAVVSHPVRDTSSAVLGAQWRYCSNYAERMASRGLHPEGLRLRTWIPLVSILRARKRWGMSLFGPDSEWLEENGLRLTFSERLRSLPAIYLILPYWRNIAQVAGWRRGRRSRSTRKHPAQAVPDGDAHHL